MALEFEINSLEGLDENVSSLYIEHNGKFRLDLDGFDPADELKAKLGEVLSEKKKLKSQNDALLEASKSIEKKKEEDERRTLVEKSEFKTLYEKVTVERDDERKANVEFRDSIKRKDINASALSNAIKSASDPGRAEMLSDKIASMSKFTDKGIVYELAGMEVEYKEILSHLSERFPFLIDGNKSSGGGATGGNDKGGGAAKTISREDFDQLTQSARGKFFASGGVITKK